MKHFLSTLAAVILGGIILSILPLIILFGIAMAFSQGDEPQDVKDNSVVVLDLSNPINERDLTSSQEMFLSMFSQNKQPIGLNELKSTLRKAKRDSRIAGLVLKGNTVGGSLNATKEIHDAVADFKTSGKFVYFYDATIGQSSLLAAAKADGIYINPAGEVDVHGLYVITEFYKNLLDKIGLKVEVVRHGQFKSAVEPFMLDKMSDASRLQTQRMVDVLWHNVRDSIASGRNINPNIIDEYVNNLGISDIDNALKIGLIDSVMYRDEFIAKIKSDIDIAPSDELPTIDFASYIKAFSPDEPLNFSDNKVAVIYAVGTIYDGSNKIDLANIYANDLAATIRNAADDDNIKAIVMRVNSPGGSALASEVIWREVILAKEKKPFFVSMGDYAASGGYYISCAADSIFAEPTTITGSIGVFGLLPVFKETFEKVGITHEKVQSNSETMVDGITPLTDPQRRAAQKMVETVYGTFTRRCADGRHTTVENIDRIGQGRVWTGEDALGIGLIDKLGSLDDAIHHAARAANIDSTDFVVYELPRAEDNEFAALMKQLSRSAKAYVGETMFGDNYNTLTRIEEMTKEPTIQARMECTYEAK